jgi:ribosomal-protein-alanine N-acetyltransferase
MTTTDPASPPSPPVRIRSCGLRHVGKLASLHAGLFDEPWDADTFRDLLGIPGTLAFLAGPGAAGPERPPPPWGLIVGRVVVDEAEILTVGVASDRRRLGIGGRLIERLVEVAGKLGARRLFLEVAEGNSAARALYARLGFETLGRRKGYYERTGAPPEDALNLCLALDRRKPELDGAPARRPRGTRGQTLRV